MTTWPMKAFTFGRSSMKKLLLMVALHLSVCLGGPTQIQAAERATEERFDKLGEQVDDILQKTYTPGGAVAIVRSDGFVWQYTSGIRNLESRRPVSEETQFRLGSISKMLVSQSVMRLVEEGRLSLKDRVRDLVPELTFENAWANEYPVRVSHLLEHTTGWDAPHFPELASNEKKPLTAKEALDLHPHSRVSRWVPGSRTAYNNTGPLVAAYIVEKVSGVNFEEFVATTFLQPLDMNDTGYFYSENYKKNAASNYRGKIEQPYWHMANRPAGGLNSNIGDMVKYAQFMLHRGSFGDGRILAESSLATTENPYDAHSARKGMELNWGLGNFNIHHNGYIYNGHEGSLMGSNAIFAYQQDLGVAHIVLTNGETPASTQIHKLLADFETMKELKPAEISKNPIGAAYSDMSGLYKPISPVREGASFFTSLLPWRVVVSEESVLVSPLPGGQPRQLFQGENSGFLQNTTGRVALVQGKDPLEGDVLYYGPQTLKQISPIGAYGPLLILLLWIVNVLIALLFALVWIPRLILRRAIGRPQIMVRLWPLISSLSAIAVSMSLVSMSKSVFPYALAGNVTVGSTTVFLGSITFALASFASVHSVWKYRKEAMNKLMLAHSITLSVLSLLVTFYLLSYGVIGIRLWS